MTNLDRSVAGVPCREVLHELSEYLDSALSKQRIAQLRAHLDGCTSCLRFGDDVAETLHALRVSAVQPVSIPPRTASALRARLTLKREPPRDATYSGTTCPAALCAVVDATARGTAQGCQRVIALGGER